MTHFLRQYIQKIVLERESLSELVYGIKRGASRALARLIQLLDEQTEALSINGYGISMTTIEEVFLR